MGEPAKTPKNSPPAARPADAKPLAAVELTAAEAARAVKRLVSAVGEDGKPTGESEAVEVTEAEVFAWAVRGERVIVVTVDGQKLEGSL